jgi:hypothetical protein
MIRTFTTVLEEYLDERDRQNSDYYKGRYIEMRTEGRYKLIDLANELDEMVQGVTEE